MNRRLSAKELATGGLIAAAYVALGVLFAPISFGMVQVRIAEVLTLLPLFTPTGVWGVTVGCALTNIYGLSIGANIAGVWDIFLGSAATFLAAWLTYRLRNAEIAGFPVLAALPPVLVNALIVGGELTYVMSPALEPEIFMLNFVSVAAGQVVPCLLVGLPLAKYLKKSGIANRVFVSA